MADLRINEIRKRAEIAIQGNAVDLAGLSVNDLGFLIQELQIHQVELQLQNEELRRMQQELEISRNDLRNLYDFAPVCYCTLDRKGNIQEANEMCADIFGLEKGQLIGQRLARFIHRADRDHFYIHQQQVMNTREKLTCEIRMMGLDESIHHIEIQSAVSGEGIDTIRMVLVDITERKNIEQTLKASQASQALRIRELNALHEATRSLLSTLDAETLLSRILEAALKPFPHANIGVIYLVPPDSRPLQVSAFALFPDANLQTIAFSNRSRYAAKVLSTRQRLLLPEIKIREGNETAAKSQVSKTRCAMIIPLVVENQIYGVLTLESTVKGVFSEADMDLLESFATTATAAIHNVRIHEQLRQTAVTDYLTKVYNRQGFFQIGQHEFQRFLRSARPLSLIALDVDEFKGINDTYGHDAGDQVLIQLAQRIKAQLRKMDIMGRFGGDEFMVLLPETDLVTARKIAKRLHRAIEDTPIQIGDQRISMTISQGVAQAKHDVHDNLNNLLKKADRALYQAKSAGRNRIQVTTVE